MARSSNSATTLDVTARAVEGSRAVRRLRRSGRVPGVIYGGGSEPQAFHVDEVQLRHALHADSAVIEISVDGDKASPVVVKETQRDPVRGDTLHVDLLRVRLDRPIQAVVSLELTGADDAPGVKLGGILEHITREVTVEALPNDIPQAIAHDVSTLEIGDTVTLDAVVAPAGVTIVGDAEAVVAMVSAPRLQAEAEAVEAEEAEAEAAAPAEESAGGEESASE